MRVLIFGPQGAGKGTHAGLLAPHWGVPHISTGDIFRENISSGTFLGRQAEKSLNAGELVPDSVTQGMLGDRLNAADAQPGFILDGFPRTTGQAEWLDAWLDSHGPLDAVVLLTAPDTVLVQRALERGRVDDTAEAIRRRLDIYTERTEPLLAFYGPLVEAVDANRPIAVVQQEIVARVSERTGIHSLHA
jgi:adenylate kinase